MQSLHAVCQSQAWPAVDPLSIQGSSSCSLSVCVCVLTDVAVCICFLLLLIMSALAKHCLS